MREKNKWNPALSCRYLALLPFLVMLPATSSGQAKGKTESVALQVDASKKFQRIDGFGVNANTRSWNGKELVPALDLLLDSLHATVWRVIVESVEKWEEVNDNDDPFVFNWEYYNNLYETPKFQKVWEMIRYLNEHGVTDNLMINFMGFAPPWMGNKVIDGEREDEFVEMIVSFFHYAIKTRHLKFGLIAPTNESEHHKYSEGPHLTAEQHTRILRKLIDRMETLGIMGNIRIVAPDNANTGIALKEFIPAMMRDSVVMSKVAHLGFHSYGGYFAGLKEWVHDSPYPRSTFWFTEWNAWCNGCDEGILGEYNYPFAAKSIGFLLDLLKNGAQAAIAWEAYDSYYEHHAPSLFSYWGILAYDPENRTYHPRKNFYAFQQVSRFVMPGAWQVSASATGDSLAVVAFYHPESKTVTIVGVNRRKKALTLNASLKNLPGIRKLEMYHTDSVVNVQHDRPVAIRGESAKVVVPADCIFTLTGRAQN
ncbi:MAG TPA: hypothetical protein VF490_20730 [Chryseosolibacter sp.]